MARVKAEAEGKIFHVVGKNGLSGKADPGKAAVSSAEDDPDNRPSIRVGRATKLRTLIQAMEKTGGTTARWQLKKHLMSHRLVSLVVQDVYFCVFNLPFFSPLFFLPIPSESPLFIDQSNHPRIFSQVLS